MNNFKFMWAFLMNDDVKRLRVFIFWSFIALLPSLYISWTIQGVQTQVVGVNAQSGNSLLPMLIGSAILPVLFTITGGLRGYHEAFSNTVIKLYSKFERKTTSELVEEFGQEEANLIVKKVDTAIYFAAFFFLEIIIFGWDLSLFPFLGKLSTLGIFGYLSDNLLLGAFVLLLEGFYTQVDGLAMAPKLFKMKVSLPFTKDKEKVEEVKDPWEDK